MGDERQARFSAWLLIRSRGTLPTVAVFGRPVSSRFRLAGRIKGEQMQLQEVAHGVVALGSGLVRISGAAKPAL